MQCTIVSTGPELTTRGELLLRSATPADRDQLVELQGAVHADRDGRPNAAVAAWTRDLFDHGHPTTTLEDVTVVEDPRTGALVSSLSLVPQRWSYAGSPLGVGRLELVATHPDYRQRGLIRRQMEVLHARSTARGDVLQVITDLMFFHGELGYQPALTQRAGRGGFACELPPPPHAGEPFRIRTAETGDIARLRTIDRHASREALLFCERDTAAWTHELRGRSAESMVRDDIVVIESPDGPLAYAVIGYGGIPSFPVPDWLPGLPCPEPALSVSVLHALPGVSWLDLVPSLLRQLTSARGADRYILWLGTEHPAYDALGECLTRHPPPIAWFVRVPDMGRLLASVAPVLERRLARSAQRHYTGTLRLHAYTYGVAIHIRAGRLVAVEPWDDHSRRASDVSLPEAMLLQLLLGHAHLGELAAAYPDHRIQTAAAELLLPLLFRKHRSSIWPLI